MSMRGIDGPMGMTGAVGPEGIIIILNIFIGGYLVIIIFYIT